jgi:hypothetical protein
VIPPALLVLLRIVLAIQYLLYFRVNFGIDFSISVKNDFGLVMGITLKMHIAFGSIAIFTILILPIHIHGRPFHLLVSSSISFYTVFKFPLWSSLTSLGII